MGSLASAPPIPESAIQKCLGAQEHIQDLEESEIDTFRRTWYYKLHDTGTLTIPEDLLDQIKEMCRGTKRTTENRREVLDPITDSMTKDRPRLVPPTPSRDTLAVAALERKTTVGPSLVKELAESHWQQLDVVRLKLYRQQSENYELRDAMGTMDREHRETMKKLQVAKDEIKMLTAELMLSDHRAVTMERGWCASEFRNAQWRDRTERKEARMAEAELFEDIRVADMKARMETMVEKPLQAVLDDLRSEGPLDQRARTRIADRTASAIDNIKGMRDPTFGRLWGMKTT